MNTFSLPMRTLLIGGLALLASGCATTGDPYYRESPVYGNPYPNNPPVIIQGPAAYPTYPAPPTSDWRHNERERERLERERRDRERWERDQRDRQRWEQDRQREAREREAREREAREREARERQRREQDARRPPARPNTGRCDYDRYNPRTGQCMPRSEDMP